MNTATAVTCDECGYEWDYSGEHERATCPNCLSQTPVENGENGLDPIVVAGDDGEVLGEISVPPGTEVDRSADGSITTVRTDDDCRVLVDSESNIGARIHRKATERDETAEEFVKAAIHDHLDE